MTTRHMDRDMSTAMHEISPAFDSLSPSVSDNPKDRSSSAARRFGRRRKGV
ncbi:hypothetical protein GCM10023193_25220 [Planotetraspora kaengkrachanensis]|uniref:Uncharacterized protein n=1 Tax=Planotetraspora kaengkrachanensis TaxID=575193 RepID=A0A8J3M727_9ACTN|nr:hypothetical protein Pka01_15770 [Planotetraspora kaengkrachanensis]